MKPLVLNLEKRVVHIDGAPKNQRSSFSLNLAMVLGNKIMNQRGGSYAARSYGRGGFLPSLSETAEIIKADLRREREEIRKQIEYNKTRRAQYHRTKGSYHK